jgi:hypothetical protein
VATQLLASKNGGAFEEAGYQSVETEVTTSNSTELQPKPLTVGISPQLAVFDFGEVLLAV